MDVQDKDSITVDRCLDLAQFVSCLITQKLMSNKIQVLDFTSLTLHSTINLYGAEIEESKSTTVTQIRIVNLKTKVMLKGLA